MNFEDFLTHKGKDFKGRNLKDIWSFSDIEIETNHDFIQIVFPLNKPSQAVSHGYYLDSQDLVDQIKTNKDASSTTEQKTNSVTNSEEMPSGRTRRRRSAIS